MSSPRITRPIITEIRILLDPSDLDACDNGDMAEYADGQRESIAAMYPEAEVSVSWNTITQQRITVFDTAEAPLLGEDERQTLEDIEESLGAFWQGYCESVDTARRPLRKTRLDCYGRLSRIGSVARLTPPA